MQGFHWQLVDQKLKSIGNNVTINGIAEKVTEKNEPEYIAFPAATRTVPIRSNLTQE